MIDNKSIREVIEALLQAIDNKNWDELPTLLHDESTYEVSGFPRFKGKESVLDYYENIRPIVSGTHTVDEIICEGGRAVCSGRFTGMKTNGEKIDILFADLIQFDELKISSRRVYYCSLVK